jgi:hypothetical protein
LRGIWYRNAFGHTARLGDDYVPKGFHPGAGPIRGHEFGLKLSPAARQDLIAFLKTL